MKNLNIYIFALLSSLFLLMSCDKDNEGTKYTPADDGVTFSGSKVSVTVPASDSYFEVYIMRANKKGALDVPITISGASDIFTYPSSVSFADGKGMDTIRFSISEDVEIGKAYPITISFDKKYTSEITAAYNSLAVTFQRDFEYEPFGVGHFYENVLDAAFGTGLIDYDVDVEKAIGFEVYRIVNPYGFEIHPLVEKGDVKVNPCYLMIDAREADAVFVPLQSMGIDFSYGVMSMGSIYGNISQNIGAYPLGTVSGKTINLGYVYLSIPGYNPFPSTGSKLVLP